MIWSVDPGESIGWCVWEDDGTLLRQTKINVDELLSILVEAMRRDLRPTKVIVEQWAFDPGKTGRGDKMVSSQVIGMLKLFAHERVELIFQDRRILKVSALHTGTPVPKSGHFADDVSAYLHGHYYFVVQGILHPRVL